MTDRDLRAERESQLRDYYAREVEVRAAHKHEGRRTELRAEFIDLVRSEDRQSVLEVGCGAGQDGSTFVTAGLGYSGVDLTPESVDYCRSLGLEATVASVLDLPFPDGAFDAGWTMSTLMHLAHDDLAPAIGEIVRVLRPGSPLAIGVWGSTAQNEHIHTTDYGPRYFATTDDESLRDSLTTVGSIERFVTWPATDSSLHYQWAVVRTR